ncbi:MAG: alpha-glucosidase C-terminal domain-containing protein [Anaerolineae bacterium]|nr:alpha-glucosidase C-terminal domain-containing protein [Anaerolineae bacterium]
MSENETYLNHAARSLKRLMPKLEEHFREFVGSHPDAWQDYKARLNVHFYTLFEIMLHLYGNQYDFFYHLEMLLISMTQAWIERPEALKDLDKSRQQHPDWFLSNQMLGAVCYVDLFAGNLAGIRRSIPYFKELGLTYLHLMPLFRAPAGENDGGYAISSYREVEPSLGSFEELTMLAAELRQNGISLVLDFVFNHTSNEHLWALNARAGNPEYQDFYFMFSDRQMPDAYETHLREIFPDEHPGAFTYFEDIQKWVWTTFHSYQWDLNYRNPTVFKCMAEEMLSLANVGVEVLRLDAVAFVWKQLGTVCENLPEAHLLIRAFNAIARIAAPSLLFKSEAIVHPDDVARYISAEECQLSYNPLMMALLWESLATREVRLLNASLQERFHIPPACAWVNYVRCHDDIGWTFSDEDAARVGINGQGHRNFLNQFYTGRFEGSFARGLPFQENPKTGDCRISGSCASLAGLEKGIVENDPTEIDFAMRRILLMHALILLAGGIPLLYLGDEIGRLNDYGYRDEPGKMNDSRWVHRPIRDEKLYQDRLDDNTVQGKIYKGLKNVINLRRNHTVFSGHEFQVIDSGNRHVFGFIRTHSGERALIFANFSEAPQVVSANQLRLYGLGYHFTDLLNAQQQPFGDITLQAYQFVCLKAEA